MAAASSTDCMWFLQGPPRIKHNSKEFPALIYRNTSICLTCFFFMLFSTVDDCYVSGRKSVGKKTFSFFNLSFKAKIPPNNGHASQKNSSNVCQTICGCWAKGEDAWESNKEKDAFQSTGFLCYLRSLLLSLSVFCFQAPLLIKMHMLHRMLILLAHI